VSSRDAASDAAFTEFATASRARLRNAAYLMCGDWERAADHVQEGLIRVYVAWPRLVRKGGEFSYARKAVVSAFLDASRRRSSTERPQEDDPTRSSSEDVAEAVTDRAALMVALARLPRRQRACVVLRYFEDLDVRETAAVMGCSEGTVKSQTSRALASLRSMFESASGDELALPDDVSLEGALRW
jgi:RNA polymerase sigma-70 factor (sigma-E family)